MSFSHVCGGGGGGGDVSKSGADHELVTVFNF